MIVTPFGDLSFGDISGLENWVSAHDQQHRAERQAIAQLKGIPLTSVNYDPPLNDDWRGKHMLEHGTLITFSNPDTSISSVLLESKWDSEAAFYIWHQVHNAAHRTLDQALGISTSATGA
jgi:hypothetical protein